MTEHETKFIELLRDVEASLCEALYRRQKTSTNNKQEHQLVLNTIVKLSYTNQDLLDAFNQDEYYKYKQLDGVLWVMDVDNRTKVDIITAYNIWLDTSK